MGFAQAVQCILREPKNKQKQKSRHGEPLRLFVEAEKSGLTLGELLAAAG
jgi:hypothetical protein